eukprot:scaffold81254_cov60-Cyclotella_meneghiniana.AAC.3
MAILRGRNQTLSNFTEAKFQKLASVKLDKVLRRPRGPGPRATPLQFSAELYESDASETLVKTLVTLANASRRQWTLANASDDASDASETLAQR